MRDELTPLNTTSRIVNFKLRSATTGQLLTGKVAGDFTGTRHVAGGTSTALSFSAGTAGDAYSSGKICPIGNGTYDWHVPDAMFTSLGQSNAVISCSGALDVVFDFQVVTPSRATAAFGANTTAPPTVTAIANEVQTRTIARVTLVDTCSVNTDMRGTNNALLASSYVAPANSDIAAIKARTDNLPNSPAAVSDVQVTVNPTTLASESVTAIQNGLATAANQTTILNRLGSITGSGVNTILGFFKALASKTATVPSDIGGTFDPANDSLEAIRDRGDAAWLTGSGGSGGTTNTDAIVDGVLAGIGARTPRFVSSFDPDTNSLTLCQRDDYVESNSRGLRFNLTTEFPEGDTILFGAQKRDQTDIAGSGIVEVNEDDEHFVIIELSTEDLDRLAGQWSYSLTHVNADEKRHTFVNAELFLEAVSTAGGGIPPD